MRGKAFTRTAYLIVLCLLGPAAARGQGTILSEGFEGSSLDPRITVRSVGGVTWGVKPTTVFGSTQAFGFGRSTCYANCWSNYTSTLVVTFPQPVYVTSLSFKEIELFNNVGSGGVVLVDGAPLIVGGKPYYHTFGRLPYNDGVADTTYRAQAFAINRVVNRIELQSWDVTGHSELFLDNLAITGVTSPFGGVALFDQSSDTIAVSGQLTLGGAATYEARVLFTSPFAGGGLVFDEWKIGLEDKILGVGPDGLFAYSFRLSDDVMVAGASLALNAWHHVAYVYDGSQERLYLDGRLIGARAAAGEIANADGPAFVGAIFRDGGVAQGFVGYLDTLRISNVARYGGSRFTPPSGDLSSDPNTLLLYNFIEAPGSSTVADLSENGHTGTLGSGFTGATAPVLTVNPMRLSAVGTATADGAMTAGEWDHAARFDFQANLPPGLGGGTAPATLFVMNDAVSLHLAVRLAVSTPIASSVAFEFDNDHDGTWPENGDEALVLTTSLGFRDEVRTNQSPPCTPDSRPGQCGVFDTSLGGTDNGQGVVANDGTSSFYEISHPLDSGDIGHDFALAPGSSVGFFMDLVLCNGGCTSTYLFYPNAIGHIVIASPANTAAGSNVPVAVDVPLPTGGSASVSLTFDQVVRRARRLPARAKAGRQRPAGSNSAARLSTTRSPRRPRSAGTSASASVGPRASSPTRTTSGCSTTRRPAGRTSRTPRPGTR